MKFDYLKKFEVKDNTAEYTIFQIDGEPTLILKPAVESNKPYFNSVLRKSRKKVKAAQAGSINSQMIKENRAEDRELFPKYVIVGWKNVVDNEGKESPFSEENCSDFINSLPDWLFDQIRTFASASENFVNDTIDTIDIGGKAKN